MFRTRKSVYIVGCSDMGAYIGNELCKSGYDVYIIDKSENAFHNLPRDYSGFKITGDASDIDFLESHIDRNAYLVLLATDSDNVNSFCAQYVKKIMGLKFVIARIYDVDKHILLDDSGIEIIYPSILTASKFREMLINHEKLQSEKGDHR